MKLQRLLVLGILVVASTGLALAAEYLGGGLLGISQLEYRTMDLRQPTTRESFQAGPGSRESEITIVFFDAFSVTDTVLGWGLWEQPFPRSAVARVIDAVAGAGARTIGLDVYLQLKYDKLNAIDQGDDLLRDAIQRAGNVVLVGPVEQTDSGPVLGRPHPYFADVSAGVGAAELPPAFGTVRDGTLVVRSGDGVEPSFALSLFAHARGMDVDSLVDETWRTHRVSLPGLPPLEGGIRESWWRGEARPDDNVLSFPLRFVGPPSSSDADDPPGTFPAVSSSTVETTAFLMPELFQDKIVLIGSGFHDSDKFRTPYFDVVPDADGTSGEASRNYGWMYGVEIHANALQNMLDRKYVHRLPLGREALLLLLVALVTGAAAFWRGATWGGVATVGALVALTVAALWLWAGRAYTPFGTLLAWSPPFVWLPFITPALAGVLSYVGSVAYVSVVEGKEKRFIKSAFSKYVSPEVVADIANHPEMLQLGGQKRTMSLLFSDLAGFTTLSEQMDPQDLLALLNDYLEDMTKIVLDQKGTLDKYIGDAIMAFWNAPKDVPDHADRALRTAILMQRRMGDLNAKWRAKDPDSEEFVVRIGINTGTAVVGNVGGQDRFDYSAIGDTVNLAARLEPANKTYHTLIMAAEFTLDAADRSAYRFRELDLMAVKGKVEPVTVYEVLEFAGVELAPHREEALRAYDAGLAAYKSRDWAGAATHFQAALAADPEDGPSQVYLGRAKEYAASPPPADWDFVVRRTEK